MKTTPLYHTLERFGATFTKKHDDWNVAAQFTDPVSEHHAVRRDVGIADVSYRGRHRLVGADRAKFLHRIVSNDVETLSAGQGTYATILTHRGKIIADFNVYVLKDMIGIDTAPETTETLFNELDKYIIADDVEISDVTAETGAIAVHGPRSSALVQSVLGINDMTDFPERHHCFHEADALFNYSVVCARTETTGEIGYTLYTSAEALAPLWERLVREGEPFNVQPIGWNALESLRIEAGVPRYGAELTDAVIPLEAELEHAIDFEKGCYIGQEIVARMKYRGHPNRLLRGIEIEDMSASSESFELSHGTQVFNKDKAVGWITSTAFAPTLGKPIAMAYVRMAVTEAGSRVQIATSEGQRQGTIALLPFTV